MRRHYESLNYVDAQPNSNLDIFRFSRTAGSDTGVLVSGHILINSVDQSMTRAQVRNLRDMLNEVLEDWQ